jgi:hypothetical protein
VKQRVQDLVAVGDKLFSDRSPILSLWQAMAENFHVMRADFTRTRYISEEFGSYLLSGRPARCHRDLKNAFTSMLRPRDKIWLHARTDNPRVNEDRQAKMWLDWASERQHKAMYDRRAQFVRATKDADGDFCAFGNTVIVREICDYDHLLYTTWHLRDVAWEENDKRVVDTMYFDWRPQARQMIQKFGKGKLGVATAVANLRNEERFKEIKARRILLPADEYDLPAQTTRGLKFVSIYVDVENQHILEETPLRNWPVTCARWESAGSMYGRQYGYSPPVVYGLPDARMQQQMMLSMLEASEMAVKPALITVGEAINGSTNLYAGGLTQVDADYDERTGEVLRPITMQLEGIRYGAEQLDRLEAGLDDAFFLNKIRFPEITKQMTAYEASKLWDEFIRGSLPLFEPVEVEYNGDLCDGTFQDLLALGRFGSVEEMPQILRGRDITFQFDTPITVAAEKALTGAFEGMLQVLVAGAQVDPDVALLADMPKATREAIDGTGAPADWLLDERKFDERRQQKAQAAAAAAQAEAVAAGADVATRVATAADSAGRAAQSLQGAGLA